MKPFLRSNFWQCFFSICSLYTKPFLRNNLWTCFFSSCSIFAEAISPKQSFNLLSFLKLHVLLFFPCVISMVAKPLGGVQQEQGGQQKEGCGNGYARGLFGPTSGCCSGSSGITKGRSSSQVPWPSSRASEALGCWTWSWEPYSLGIGTEKAAAFGHVFEWHNKVTFFRFTFNICFLVFLFRPLALNDLNLITIQAETSQATSREGAQGLWGSGYTAGCTKLFFKFGLLSLKFEKYNPKTCTCLPKIGLLFYS